MSNLISFYFIQPELYLAGGALLLFVISAFSRKPSRWHSWIFPIVTLFYLGASLVALVLMANQQSDGNSYQCMQGGCKAFFGLLAVDPLSVYFRGLIYVATFFCVLLSIGSPSLPKEQRGEYHALLLVLAVGLSFLTSANHLLMVYLGLEMVSLVSYLLTGWDGRRGRSAEAGLKYVLYGGVASGIMLFGMSLLFGLFGDLSLQGLQYAMMGSPALLPGAGQWATQMAVLFVLVGFGFKIAAVPFHMWCPDVYEGAPTPFTAFLSVAPKAAGFALLLRFFYSIFLAPNTLDNMLKTADQVPWLPMLWILSALSMTLGNLAAIKQNNLKRLLAYSSIAHAGYMLMGVVAGGTDGFVSVSVYAFVYLMMNLGAFAIVSAVDRTAGSEDISAFRGLGKRSWPLALMMAIFLFSLTGLPPTAGFVGKLYLFASLLKHGGDWWMILAAIGIFNSVISLYYYARVLKAMYLEKSSPDPVVLRTVNSATLVAALLAVPTLLLGIFWQPLATLGSWSAGLFHP